MNLSIGGAFLGLGLLIMVRWGGIVVYDITHYPLQSGAIALVLYGCYRMVKDISDNA